MSLPSDAITILAKAILHLHTHLPADVLASVRALVPEHNAEPAAAEPAAEPAAAEPAAAEPAAAEEAKPVKPKVVRKITKGAKPAAPAAAEAAPAASAAAEPAAAAADPYRNHPSRIKPADINPALCIARRIDEQNPLPGTRPGDESSNGGRIFPECQCTKKPEAGSKLCKNHAKYEAEMKANPDTRNTKWYGRLDDETLYYRSLVVGSGYFHDKYPSGIQGDTFQPNGAPVAPSSAPKGKAPRVKKAATPAVNETVASNKAAINIDWMTFMYEGTMHIRNLKNGRTYLADSQKHTLEEMVMKESYVGRWVDDHLELAEDDTDEE